MWSQSSAERSSHPCTPTSPIQSSHPCMPTSPIQAKPGRGYGVGLLPCSSRAGPRARQAPDGAEGVGLAGVRAPAHLHAPPHRVQRVAHAGRERARGRAERQVARRALRPARLRLSGRGRAAACRGTHGGACGFTACGLGLESAQESTRKRARIAVCLPGCVRHVGHEVYSGHRTAALSAALGSAAAYALPG